MLCFEGFCAEHYKLHSQKLGADHATFLTVQKKQKCSPSHSDDEKQSKMLKLEIPAEKKKEFEYFYDVEGENLELSQLNVLHKLFHNKFLIICRR